ncbi:LemA family protein [Flavipsychrobacter stenotrophus]|uniref:LemA family protein n=1 Tax=Flavipsychrobacter stenotrophus TaxID=2077091 RepID=A0A2S7T0V2_9BACT|nr:LemA family protein [Flavipsychrobacter stenotrophus]PQJ12833.1 LemA family protein [Flavipsychrobacter stenotrophus]
MKGLYIFLGIVVMLVLMGGCSYNGMNSSRVVVDQKWADVQSSYQRRSDLIPNLVEVVKGVADFEKTTLTQVIEARASASSIKVDPKDLTPEKLKEFQASQGQLSQALGRLMVVSEQYPQLKANENFKQLQDQLEGTENRIKTARDAFNEAVTGYNIQVTSFPKNLLAGMFGFKERAMFQADPAAQSAPKVKF